MSVQTRNDLKAGSLRRRRSTPMSWKCGRLHTAAQVAVPTLLAGYGFRFEYRGYSGLGESDEAGLYADGRAYMG